MKVLLAAGSNPRVGGVRGVSITKPICKVKFLTFDFSCEKIMFVGDGIGGGGLSDTGL